MWANISSTAHYRVAGGDYSCQQGHERTFQGFMGSNLKRASPSSFSTVVIPCVTDAVGSAYLVMKFLNSVWDNGKMCRVFFIIIILS